MSMRGFCCDDETGEITFYDVNEETGEPSAENHPPLLTRRIPAPEESPSKYTKFPRGYSTKTKQFQSLKERIITGSNTVSHRLLLIPTLMVFSSVACMFLMILEIYLHVRCHKKNKKLRDPNLYYRSPFHMITSTFCGVCRDNDTASKIGQLQDKRRDRYDYVRSLAI